MSTEPKWDAFHRHIFNQIDQRIGFSNDATLKVVAQGPPIGISKESATMYPVSMRDLLQNAFDDLVSAGHIIPVSNHLIPLYAATNAGKEFWNQPDFGVAERLRIRRTQHLLDDALREAEPDRLSKPRLVRLGEAYFGFSNRDSAKLLVGPASLISLFTGASGAIGQLAWFTVSSAFVYATAHSFVSMHNERTEEKQYANERALRNHIADQEQNEQALAVTALSRPNDLSHAVITLNLDTKPSHLLSASLEELPHTSKFQQEVNDRLARFADRRVTSDQLAIAYMTTVRSVIQTHINNAHQHLPPDQAKHVVDDYLSRSNEFLTAMTGSYDLDDSHANDILVQLSTTPFRYPTEQVGRRSIAPTLDM